MNDKFRFLLTDIELSNSSIIFGFIDLGLLHFNIGESSNTKSKKILPNRKLPTNHLILRFANG
jgi:hypothetical protein